MITLKLVIWKSNHWNLTLNLVKVTDYIINPFYTVICSLRQKCWVMKVQLQSIFLMLAPCSCNLFLAILVHNLRIDPRTLNSNNTRKLHFWTVHDWTLDSSHLYSVINTSLLIYGEDNKWLRTGPSYEVCRNETFSIELPNDKLSSGQFLVI